MKYLLLSLILGTLYNSCQFPKTSQVTKISEKIEKEFHIPEKDQEKLWSFIKNREAYPFLAIDSITAVDSLKVLPESYHFIKESLRWKKKYPAEDFLQLRSYVRSIGHLRILTIDSITAVDSLKVAPEAFSDIKENILDCNRVFDSEIWKDETLNNSQNFSDKN
jgi:hypothetical protein